MFAALATFAVARLAAALCAAAIMFAPPSGFAATPAPAIGSPAATDDGPKVRELLSLLADPQVQKWLAQQGAAKAATAASTPDVLENSIAHYFDGRATAIRQHLAGLAATLPDLPSQFAHGAALVSADLGQGGRIKALVLLAVFVALGWGVEWLCRAATKRLRQRLDELPLETVAERLRAVAARFAVAVGLLAAFAIGSVGAFLALDWTPLLREMVSGYLVAILAIRATMLVCGQLLSPDAERFRIIPTSAAAARFWYHRVTAFVGWFAVGFVSVGLLATLGWTIDGRRLVAYTLGLGLVAIALEGLWRRPTPAPDAAGEGLPPTRRLGPGARNVLLSVDFALLWLLWVLRAMPSFWFLLVVTALPLAIAVINRGVDNLLRPAGSAPAEAGPPSVVAVGLERGLRALLIIGGAAVLAWGWGVDLVTLAASDSLPARLVHGALSAVIIMLIADVVWHVARAAIDSKLAGAADLGQPNTDEARRRARIRTLLPIFRNVLFVVVVAVAAMMALAALGVEIGPLIAGASVVGVAIGFGAQTFVRDVIAGMFYLVDDAFRVGEYIQSGNFKGTVEGFSIRSVKLRHHRGPLYTVPFGLLGAVQNQSRDWVIDKMTLGVTYDSDVEKARKLIKQIGQQLAQDPEYAPLIIQPLKMQGIEQFGDFAVQIRTKMMTVPGEQFVIRRKALALIKKAFDENGIKFAFPTVQLAGEGDAGAGGAGAAIAQRGLELTQQAAQ